MAQAIFQTVTLEPSSCDQCGVSFAAPDWFWKARRKDGQSLFCPNGHSLAFKETEVDRLRKKLDEQMREASRQAQRALEEQVAREAEEKLRIKAERKLKRVQKGVCPQCNRSFPNLARHMECKHGDTRPKGVSAK